MLLVEQQQQQRQNAESGAELQVRPSERSLRSGQVRVDNINQSQKKAKESDDEEDSQDEDEAEEEENEDAHAVPVFIGIKKISDEFVELRPPCKTVTAAAELDNTEQPKSPIISKM